MKKVIAFFLASFLLIPGSAFPNGASAVPVESRESVQKKPLFSTTIDEAIDKLDPVAFEEGLQEFGPCSIHMRGLLVMILKNWADVLTDKQLIDALKGRYNHTTLTENFILLSSSLSLSVVALLSLLNYLEKKKFSAQSPSVKSYCQTSSPYSLPLLSLRVGTVMALYALWGIRWSIKNYRKKEQEKAEKKERSKQEYKKQLNAIDHMFEILSRHPLKEDS